MIEYHGSYQNTTVQKENSISPKQTQHVPYYIFRFIYTINIYKSTCRFIYTYISLNICINIYKFYNEKEQKTEVREEKFQEHLKFFKLHL